MPCEFSDLILICEGLHPDHLEFEAREGYKYVLPYKHFRIKKAAGGGTLPPRWTVQVDMEAGVEGAAWLKAWPMSGRGAKKITVSADPREMKTDEWKGTIKVVPDDARVTVTPAEIPVTMTIKGEETPPSPEKGIIEVAATLDAEPWSGPVEYKLSEETASAPPITGSSVPNSHTVDCGTWRCAYVLGGPVGAAFVNIVPSPLRSVSDGPIIRFTLRFLRTISPPPPPKYKCPHCEEEFDKEEDRKRHIEQEHPEPLPEEPWWGRLIKAIWDWFRGIKGFFSLK